MPSVHSAPSASPGEPRPTPATRRPPRRRRLPASNRDSPPPAPRSEEHTSELQSLMRISYAVFCLTKKIPVICCEYNETLGDHVTTSTIKQKNQSLNYSKPIT